MKEYEVEVTAEVTFYTTVQARSPEEAESDAEVVLNDVLDHIDGLQDVTVVTSEAMAITDEPLEEEDEEDFESNS